MNAACDAERRAFLKALTATTVVLATGGCGNSPRTYVAASGTTSGPPPPPPPPPGNQAPVWATVPTITFTQGVAATISIAAYATDPNGDTLTVSMTSGTLPAGVTFDAPNKRFVYDGVGALGSASGVVLTADDGH